MAKFTLIFIVIFCIMQMTLVMGLLREKREEAAETTSEKTLTVESIATWFGEIGKNFQEFTDKHITDDRKKVKNKLD